MSTVKILLRNIMSNDVCPIIGYSYEDKQIMRVILSDEELISTYESSFIKSSITKAELEEDEEYQMYMEAEDKLLYASTKLGVRKIPSLGVYIKTVPQVVPHITSVTLSPSQALLKKIANKDILYYNTVSKTISKSFQ